jgi:hypothetical protein
MPAGAEPGGRHAWLSGVAVRRMRGSGAADPQLDGFSSATSCATHGSTSRPEVSTVRSAIA